MYCAPKKYLIVSTYTFLNKKFMQDANTTAPLTDTDDNEFDEDAEELEGFGIDDEDKPGQSDLVESSDDQYWNADE